MRHPFAATAQKASKAFARQIARIYPERLKLPPVDSLPNKCRDKIGRQNSSPTPPIPLYRFSTRDEIYPQAVNLGERRSRLRDVTRDIWSQYVGKRGAAP